MSFNSIVLTSLTYSVWVEKRDKLWGMSEKCDGKFAERAFYFCLADFFFGLTEFLCVCMVRIDVSSSNPDLFDWFEK